MAYISAAAGLLPKDTSNLETVVSNPKSFAEKLRCACTSEVPMCQCDLCHAEEVQCRAQQAMQEEVAMADFITDYGS